MSQTPTVLLAMSGGIDSSAAALLLLESGYDVHGVTLHLWPEHAAGEVGTRLTSCCSVEALERAETVASCLGIPHHVLDYTAVFEQTVVRPFCDTYVAGRTPNPCVVCNRDIKFGKLWQAAHRSGMDYLATGHYSRVERQPTTGECILRRGADMRKDQSYVLSRLTQEQLQHILLPLGNRYKEDIRHIAERVGLDADSVPESQEVCFVAGNDYRRFVTERVPEASRHGPILDTTGRQVGEHRGIAFYTVGQRKGIRVVSRERTYVVRIDANRNALIVGPETALYTSSALVEDVSWAVSNPPDDGAEVEVQVRRMHRPAPARIRLTGAYNVRIEFTEPQRAVTPGQTAAFYRGDVVLGAGTLGYFSR